MAKLYAVATTSATGGLAAFFDDLVRVETRIYNAVNDRLRAAHGIVASQFELLRYLRDHPQSRVADLATAFAIGIGAASKAVDRHEANGWVARLPNPADRRSSLISLTGAGAALVAEAEETFHGHLEELITATIGAEELSSAGATLAVLRQALEEARVGIPAG